MKNIKKNTVWWIIGAAVLMLIVPWLAAVSVPENAAMLIMLLLLFGADPFFSLLIGFFSGSDVRRLFWLPVLSAGLSLAGMWTALDMGNLQFLFYAAVYLVLGLAAMGARAMYHRNRLKPDTEARG